MGMKNISLKLSRFLSRFSLVLTLVLFGISLHIWGMPEPPQPPKRVNDFAGMLAPGGSGRLESLLAAYEDSTSTQIAVVLVENLEGYDVADYASRLFETWNIGQKGVNNGLLMLVSRDERKIRLETGYGLEERLTDAMSRRIIEQDILPLFRAGNVEGGITAGIYRITEVLSGAYQAKDRSGSDFWSDVKRGLPFSVVILFILLLLIARGAGGGGGGGRATYSGRGRSMGGPMFFPMGGGGFGGGFGGGSGGGWGGFGGGMSGGGGASGSW
jgi:uncharacterized protein